QVDRRDQPGLLRRAGVARRRREDRVKRAEVLAFGIAGELHQPVRLAELGDGRDVAGYVDHATGANDDDRGAADILSPDAADEEGAAGILGQGEGWAYVKRHRC